MRVEVAKTAGFCPGVKRAVDMVEAAARSGIPTVTYGPIIHNHHVVERFAGMGVHEISHFSEVTPGTQVIIRSHGVSRAVYEGLEAQGAVIEDATCPYVASASTKLSPSAEKQGRTPIIIGDSRPIPRWRRLPAGVRIPTCLKMPKPWKNGC